MQVFRSIRELPAASCEFASLSSSSVSMLLLSADTDVPRPGMLPAA